MAKEENPSRQMTAMPLAAQEVDAC